MPGERGPEAVVPRIASAPGSSANLGPGFDALAVALELRVTVAVEPAPELRLIAEGEGAALPAGPEHLAVRVVTGVLGHDRVAIRVNSEIPVARGLGSSAALAAAAAGAAGAPDPLAVAAGVDGHPENAAASVLGGLVAATTLETGEIRALRLDLDPELAFVVVIPDEFLPTDEARRALPAEVPLADAAHNLGRMAVLVGALANRRHLRPELMADRLHQPYRSLLSPQASRLIDGLLAAGAFGAAWSGAGPSIVAVTELSRGAALREAAADLLAGGGQVGDARLLRPDMRGLSVAEA